MTAQVPARELPEPILIVGAYGYRNLGDEAILAGLLTKLGRQARVSVVSRAPADTQALHGVRSVAIGSAVAELRRHRSVLIGGGGLFGRDLGRLGRLVAPFGLAAAALGKTVAISAVGVDREQPTTTVGALKLLARHVARFTVRDIASRDALSQWGIEAGIVDDLSAAMPAGPRKQAEALLRGAGLRPTSPIVGLCLTGVDQRLTAPLEPAVAKLVVAFPGLQFCFIPMSQHPYVAAHNDLLLGNRLKALSPRIAVLEGVLAPSQLLAVFSLLSGAVCMRYHSLLFAHRVGIPMIAIPYAEKCRTWLADRGIEPTAPDGPQLIDALGSALNQGLERSA